jgi:hypothetical protein
MLLESPKFKLKRYPMSAVVALGRKGDMQPAWLAADFENFSKISPRAY